jgi:hypothetical protein
MAQTVLAIDPGPEHSAYVIFSFGVPVSHAKVDNATMKRICEGEIEIGADILVIEQVAAMGMAVGAEVFETVFWSGRFVEAWRRQWDRVKRHEVKMHLCGNMRAKDGNIRTAIIDRYGPGKDKAIGRKASPGPLFGLSGDCWSALAVAITWTETKSA